MDKKIKFIRIAGFSALMVLFGLFFFVNAGFAQSQTIRVRIADDAESFFLTVRKSYKLYDIKDNTLIKESSIFLKEKITPEGIGAIKIGSCILNLNQLRVDCCGERQFFLNKRRYKGDLSIILKDNGKFTLINTVDLEDYLKSVVPSEIPWYWPYEVLKAQAVIARTFAVDKRKKNSKNMFDVTGDIYSQVYGGDTSRRFRASRAVEKTKGMVLKCEGKIFPAFFHATCGGHTEDVENLWGPAVASLRGVKCDYCRDSLHFKWFKKLNAAEILKGLQKKEIDISDIKDLRVLNRNSTDRVVEILIVTTGGEKIIKGNDFRNAVGSKIIRSLNFSIIKEGKDFVFDGFGWGHGVGFCQWGGYFMARAGKSFRQILQYYYPKSTIGYLK
ncbi:MAG: SpoIID/LytB domain-containing protein [Candidatus Gygaella obscura]|nr:SpoIID/LytB domain-containing protein [Candidatus Gygaella obscura]